MLTPSPSPTCPDEIIKRANALDRYRTGMGHVRRTQEDLNEVQRRLDILLTQANTTKAELLQLGFTEDDLASFISPAPIQVHTPNLSDFKFTKDPIVTTRLVP